MNPLKIIRWKVLIVVALLFLVLDFVAFPKYLEARLEKELTQRFGSTAYVDDISFKALNGEVRIEDPVDKTKWLMETESLELKIKTMSLLTRRVDAEFIDIIKPKFSVERNDDGSLSTEKKPSKYEPDAKEIAEKAKKIYDRAKQANDWYGRVKEIMAKLKARGIIEEENAKEIAALRGRTELREFGPRLILGRFLIDGIDVELRGDKNLPSLAAGLIKASNISSMPSFFDKPMDIVISSRLDNAEGPLFKLLAKVDSSDAINKTEFGGMLDNIDVTRLKPLIGDTLPVELLSGKISASFRGKLQDTDHIDLWPVLVFENLKVKAKPEIGKVAGFLASTLTDEISLAGTFALADIHVHGDPFNPTVDLGDTMSTLMKMGGKAFAKAIGEKMAQELLGHLRGRIPGGEAILGIPSILLGGEGDIGDALGGALFGEGGPNVTENPQAVVGAVLGGLSQSGKIDLGKGGLGQALGGLLGGESKSGDSKGLLEGLTNPKKEGGKGLIENILGGKKDAKPGEKEAGPEGVLKGILNGGKKDPEADPKTEDPDPKKKKKPSGSEILKGILGGK